MLLMIRRLLFMSALFALGACSQEERRPNVILISIDSLRADHVGCYGYERPTTPHLDRFAAEGVRFDEHISSSSWTLPAHASLFTSVPDSVHGCVESDGVALSPSFTTLAERFQSGGYSTAGFYAGPYLHSAFGLGQGFDEYRYVAENAAEFGAAEVRKWGLDPSAHARTHKGVTNPLVYEAASAWLAEREEPFFLFLHFWDVHYDFTPPAPWDTRFNPGYNGPVTGENFFFDQSIRADMPAADRQQLLALYDGEIGWTDSFLGRLREELERLGLADNTVLAITSDHGTEFFDHGGKGHRTTLYEELIRVPFVLWYPSALESAVVQTQTRSIDVGPTLLELADLPPLPDSSASSLLNLARGGTLQFDNLAVSELYSVGNRLRSVRIGQIKIVLDENQPDAPLRWYDLSLDPSEQRARHDFDQGAGQAAQLAFLKAQAQLLEAVSPRPGAPTAATLPPSVLEALRANGYLGSEDED